jgi:DNA-binding IclR family transcriptional regulator
MTKSLEKKTVSTGRKVYSAPALEKGLDLIELLANEIDGLNIGEITAKLNKSVGELFRMLVVLEQRGYVEMSDDSDRYRLTLKMFGLANRFPPIKRLNTIANPIMQKLSYNIEQSSHLVIYYEGKGHVVVQQDSPSERIFSVRLGAEVPLINTCSGHILLAFSDKEKYQMMLNKIPDHHVKADNKSFLKIMKRVKEQGSERILSAQAQGVEDIGYPIFDYNGEVIAALAVPFLEYLDGSHKISFTDAQVKIQAAATEISTKLGFEFD